MGKTARTEQIPRWARDFVARRQQELLEEDRQQKRGREEQTSDNTYLLYPFDHKEVEAIRHAVQALEEEAFLDDIQKNEKSRKAGQFVPDSGFSLESNFTSERYFRRLLLTPLGKQQMQEAVVKYYGWGKWSEDPWGDFLKFCEWVNSVSDDERLVWAINETFGGRVYLSLWILKHLSQFDYSKITEEDLLTYIGQGAENFLLVKTYTGWDDFNYHYPKEPLPTTLVNKDIIKVYLGCPFRGFRWFVNSIYLWYFALDEAKERATEHPELEGFLDYHTATDIQIAELCRKLAPKDHRFPSANEAWGKLDMALEKGKKPLEGKYGDILDGGAASTWESLLTGVNEWKSKAADAAIAGLKGQLGNSLLSIVKNDFIDALRKEDRLFARLWQKAQTLYQPKTNEEKIKLSERVQHLCDKIQRTEPLAPSDSDLLNSLINSPQEEAELIHAAKPLPWYTEIETEDGDNYCLGDMIEDEQAQSAENIEEPIDLERVGLDINELTPKEIALLNELNDMVSKGYSRDSKQGLSFKEYWGKDYDRKIKMLQRLNAKRQKL